MSPEAQIKWYHEMLQLEMDAKKVVLAELAEAKAENKRLEEALEERRRLFYGR